MSVVSTPVSVRVACAADHCVQVTHNTQQIQIERLNLAEIETFFWKRTENYIELMVSNLLLKGSQWPAATLNTLMGVSGGHGLTQ